MAYQMLEFENYLPKIAKQGTETEILQQSTEVSGSQPNQDFCQDNKDIPKKKECKAKTARKNKTPYSPTKIKARNFLSNISYSRVCEGDFSNACFVADTLIYITTDLKPFFLETTYFHIQDREMVRMLWEECLPQRYYDYIKQPENFELLHSNKLTFKQVKDLIGSYLFIPGAWKELIEFFKKYHAIYQYTYAHLFPKTYSNRDGFAKKVQYKMCLENWRQKKRNQETGKNPFNFSVPNAERHPFEQLPITDEITFVDDDKHRADVPDTRKNLPPSTTEKNIPPYPPADPAPSESVKQRFVYAPTMVGIKQFDKKYKLPKQQKKTAKKQKSAEEIQVQNEKLEAELAENDLKMKIINKGKNISKKNV